MHKVIFRGCAQVTVPATTIGVAVISHTHRNNSNVLYGDIQTNVAFLWNNIILIRQPTLVFTLALFTPHRLLAA